MDRIAFFGNVANNVCLVPDLRKNSIIVSRLTCVNPEIVCQNNSILTIELNTFRSYLTRRCQDSVEKYFVASVQHRFWSGKA